MAAQVEPRSPYYQKLRETARDKYNQGWPTKATEALGEGSQVSAEDLRAVGFAIVECLMSPTLPAVVPGLRQGHGGGQGEARRRASRTSIGATREDFLNNTGDWVAERYGQDQ